MSAAKFVDVTILGREFTVSCTDEERQGLMNAVSYLDTKMHEIRDSGKVVGIERIAIMTALNLSHELLNTKTGDVDIGDYKRRISLMQNQIDEANQLNMPKVGCCNHVSFISSSQVCVNIQACFLWCCLSLNSLN